MRNILEFGDPGSSDEQRLKMALDHFTQTREEVVLTVSRLLVLSDTVRVDTTYVSLEFTHGNVDARKLTDRPAFVFTGSSKSGYPYTRSHVTGLRLLGPGSGTSKAPGIVFEAESPSAVRGVGFYGLEVSGFATGLEFRSNAFLLSFFNFHVYRCGTAISMPAGYANYGENLKFIGGGLGTSDVAVYNANPNGNFHLISTSIDFCRAAIVAEAGGVFLSEPHIEFNEVGARSNEPHFRIGPDSSAKLTIHGGHLFFHEPPTAPTIFYASNKSWGGGIHINGTSFMSTSTSTGYLCGGPGRFVIGDIIYYDGGGSGSSMGALMPNQQANKLVDGGFDLATVVDAFVNNTDATSRTASPALRLTTKNSMLVVNRIGSKSGTVAIDIPVEPGRLFAMSITFGTTSSSGTLQLIESFIASRGTTAAGTPVVLRNQARGATGIPMTTIAQNASYRRVFGAGTWDRFAPAWATHYRLRLLFDQVGVGETTIDEIVVTAL